MTVSKILQGQAGIQYGAVTDKSGADPRDSLNNVFFTGQFKRGRFDKPMKIHSGNVRAMLGYDPENKDYVAIEDALATGVPFVWVQRVSGEDSTPLTCALSLELKFKNLVRVPDKQLAVCLIASTGEKHIIPLDEQIISLQDGNYSYLGGALNSLSWSDIGSQFISPRIYDIFKDDFNTDSICAVYSEYLELFLRKGTTAWTTMLAGVARITYKGNVYDVPYSAYQFSYAYEIYDYIQELYANISNKLNEIGGFQVTVLDDTTFKGSYDTSFNSGYFPKLKIVPNDKNLSQFSLQLVNDDGWMLDGYTRKDGCLQKRSGSELIEDTSALVIFNSPFAVSQIPNSGGGEYIENENIESEAYVTISTEELEEYENFMTYVENHKKDIKLKLCWKADSRPR